MTHIFKTTIQKWLCCLPLIWGNVASTSSCGSSTPICPLLCPSNAIQLPENVSPTITGRDFVIATVAAPTVVKEPEKPAEETAEGAEATPDGEAPKEGEEAEKKDDAKKSEDKKEASPEKK